MKVVGFIGSPNLSGNTSTLVESILKGAEKKGAEVKSFNLNKLEISGCQSCYACKRDGRCAVKDDMQNLYDEITDSDAIVIGSPIYMWHVTGQTKIFLDRLFAFFGTAENLKIANKKVVMAFLQGNENPDMFKEYLNHTVKMMKFLGFDVVDTILSVGNKTPDNVRNDNVMLEKAESIGKELVYG